MHVLYTVLYTVLLLFSVNKKIEIVVAKSVYSNRIAVVFDDGIVTLGLDSLIILKIEFYLTTFCQKFFYTIFLVRWTDKTNTFTDFELHFI